MKRPIEMKSMKQSAFAAIAALLGLVLIAGCTTTSGTDRNKAAVVTMVQVEEDIKLLLFEVSITNSVLASIVNPLQDDLNVSFEVFTDGIESLDSASDRFISRSRKMETQGREYFAEWRKQGDTFENRQIRELNEQHRTELSLLYANIAESSGGIEGELVQYVSDVKEIEIYFADELTVRSITAIKPIVDQTIIDGFQLSRKLRDLLRSVEIARANLLPLETEDR
ncbi:hypothetical protein [Spirochaeta dissipatitropha]